MWNLLSGTRILDLTRLLPGPYGTQLLADLGAEVIRVENPGAADWFRQPSPAFGSSPALFPLLNRNKKSLTLNLKAPKGREAFLRLAEHSDAILEGFRPGVVQRLGIDYEAVRASNPRIVYCSLSGYGQTGPNRGAPGHDLNYVAMAGLLGLNLAEGPLHLPLPVSDLAGGLFAALSMVAALHKAAREGKGAYIDIAMSDTIVSLLTVHFAHMFGASTEPTPANSILFCEQPCYSIYRAADGKHFTVGALEPKFWASLCQLMGVPEYADRQFEVAAYPEMLRKFRAAFATRTRSEWLEKLAAADVPAGPVNTLAEAEHGEQAQARGLFFSLGSAGKQVAFPAQIHGACQVEDAPAPRLGQHTHELLASIGYSGDEIEKLRG